VASFSKADYLLPSTATPVEIAAFLSSIRAPIVRKSPWYTPEPEHVIPPPPKMVDASTITSTALYNSSSKPPTPTTLFPSTTRPGSSHRAAAGQPSKLSRITGAVVNPRPSSSQNNSSHNAAIQYFSATTSIHDYAPSVTSIATTNSEAERREKEDKDWENFYIADEDSEDDAYDRMVMGRSGAKIMGTMGIGGRAGKFLGAPERKKGNSRKALKWLGLA